MASFWTLGGAVGLRGLNIITFILVARYLGTESFGKFGVIQSTALLLTRFSVAGLTTAASKFVAEFRAESPQKAFEIAVISLLIAVALSGMFSALLILFANFISVSILRSQDLSSLLRLSSPWLVFLAANNVFIGILNGYEKYNANAAINTTKGIITVLTVPFSVRALGLEGGIVGLAVVEALCSSLYFYYFLRVRNLERFVLKFRLVKAFRENAQPLLQFCAPLLLGVLLTAPAIWLAKVYLANQPSGYINVGVFNAAEKLYQLALFIPSALSVFLLPMMTNLKHQNNTRGYYKVFYANVGMNVSIVLILMLISTLFSQNIMGLFGPDFSGSSITFRILLIAAVGAVLNTCLGQFLLSRNLAWLRMIFDVMWGVLLLGSAFILIPSLQDRGLAISYAFSYSGTTLLLFLCVVYISRKDVK